MTSNLQTLIDITNKFFNDDSRSLEFAAQTRNHDVTHNNQCLVKLESIKLVDDIIILKSRAGRYIIDVDTIIEVLNLHETTPYCLGRIIFKNSSEEADGVTALSIAAVPSCKCFL